MSRLKFHKVYAFPMKIEVFNRQKFRIDVLLSRRVGSPLNLDLQKSCKRDDRSSNLAGRFYGFFIIDPTNLFSSPPVGEMPRVYRL